MLRIMIQTPFRIISSRVPMYVECPTSRVPNIDTLISSNLACFSSGVSNEFEEIPRECQYDYLKKAVQKGAKLIDVRQPSELKEHGKIPKSVNVPLNELEDAFRMEDAMFLKKYGFPKPKITTEIVLTCRSGKRATDAFLKLSGLGYHGISVYKGSFEDWVQRGELVEK